MFKQQFLNSLPLSIIKEVINDYEQRNLYDTSSMNKADPGKSLDLVIPYCKKVLGYEIEFCSGNFYQHTHPYFPHTDFRTEQDNNINIVIPLQYIGENLPSLVVFDQAWYHNSVTWCLDHKVMHFSVNTGVPNRPADYRDVQGLTGIDIDETFYKTYLSHHSKESYFGLSGDAFLFQSGSMIIFDNKLIHCTSKFLGTKLGLSLRFRRK